MDAIVMGKTVPDFIFIDDDPVTNDIYRIVLEKAIPGATIQTFTDPRQGLTYIRSAYSPPAGNNAVLFLDINMPVLSGWEVLDVFNNFSDDIKRNITIFVMSSSIDMNDKKKAETCPLVMSYFSKPFTINELRTVLFRYSEINLD